LWNSSVSGDREHQPAPEPVIGRAAIVGLDQQTGGNGLVQQPLLLENLGLVVARIGGIADLEALQGLGRQPAFGDIVPRALPRSRAECQAVHLHRLLHHLDQPGQPVLAFGRLRVVALFRHRDPGIAGQYLDRLDERDILDLLDEGDRIALRLAAEAVIEPLAVIDMERRRLFLMERARCPEISLGGVRLALVPQHLAPDDIREGQPVAQLVEESGWERHAPTIAGAA
jgi:hypothetical protein